MNSNRLKFVCWITAWVLGLPLFGGIGISPSTGWAETPLQEGESCFTAEVVDAPVDVRFRSEVCKHVQRAAGLSFSFDGRYLASSGATDAVGSNAKQAIYVHDLKNGKRLHTFSSTYGTTHDVAIAPQGDIVATAEDNGEIQIFDLDSGERRRVFRTGRYSEGVPAFTFLPGGEELLISTSRRGGIARWSRRGEQVYESERAHKNRSRSLEITPDGKRAITTAADKTFAVWDVATGKLLHQGDWEGAFPAPLAISPDGKSFAIGDGYTNVRSFSLSDYKPLVNYRTDQKWHLKSTFALTYSPDGQFLLSAEGRYKQNSDVRVWDVKSGKLVGSLQPQAEMVLNMKFSPDGKTLAVAGSNGTVKLFEWQELALPQRPRGT